MINLRKKCGLGVFVPQDFLILKREKDRKKKEVTINIDISKVDPDWLHQLRKMKKAKENQQIRQAKKN